MHLILHLDEKTEMHITNDSGYWVYHVTKKLQGASSAKYILKGTVAEWYN